MFKLSDIELGERAARETGDLHKLAADIAHRGMRHPVTLSPRLRLITGARRLAAHRDQLGWPRIEGQIITRIPEALAAIVSEEKDGRLARPRTVPETMALDRAMRSELQWFEPAADREAPNGGYNAVIARVYGLNTSQYAKAREICEAASGYREFAGNRTLVPDSTRKRGCLAASRLTHKTKILAVHRWFKGDLPEEDLAAAGDRRAATRMRPDNISSALATLTGITIALQGVSLDEIGFDAKQAADWDAELTANMQALRDFRKRLQKAG